MEKCGEMCGECVGNVWRNEACSTREMYEKRVEEVWRKCGGSVEEVWRNIEEIKCDF